MTRCDLNTHGECSCLASNVPCKVQAPVYLILEEANTGAAKHGNACLILLAIFVFAIIIGLGAQAGPVNV
ncbi:MULTISPECIES: hypothetical protein [unclassified Shinella]|uniref:hypothetical protein n=1 Tax=unclassified Shinella TaxID=2643062 RepID=UPI00234F5B44|nr:MULTISPECIES: hypothetical protein [unclassified Shinella]MCO5152536.1 hypothetical protein [Shinella sp.]MDC7261829.1 hypothetical protein [Shinella sp. HY16]MDC7268724.1 hypothetical protein [Shinella sp. YZ44]